MLPGTTASQISSYPCGGDLALGRGEQQAADTAAARGGGDHDLLQLVGLDDQDAEEIVAVDGHG